MRRCSFSQTFTIFPLNYYAIYAKKIKSFLLRNFSLKFTPSQFKFSCESGNFEQIKNSFMNFSTSLINSLLFLAFAK